MKPNETKLRSRQEIDADYTQCAIKLGDLSAKMVHMQGVYNEEMAKAQMLLNERCAAPAEAEPVDAENPA